MHGERAGAPPDPHAPSVFVVDGKIVVNQDPIIIVKSDYAPIVWQLESEGPFTFPDDGIVITDAPNAKVEDAKDQFKCHVEQDRRRYTCDNRHTRPASYKYTIKVLENGAPIQPPLDPWIWNG
jgi:hypothetical protein